MLYDKFGPFGPFKEYVTDGRWMGMHYFCDKFVTNKIGGG